MFNDDKEKDYLRVLLTERPVELSFLKKDGTVREMKCTLKEDLIPSEKQPKGTSGTPRKQSQDSIAVFDLVINEWRSFRFDSVKEVKFDI
jgi:hypothetical protein